MVAELKVRRWTRGAHDRLYVNTADGARVGWRDLRTGEDHVAVVELRAEFLAAADGWARARRESGPPPAPPQAGAPPAVPPSAVPRAVPPSAVPRPRAPVADRGDLADRRAGEALVQRADRLRIQNPVLRRAARLLGRRTRDFAWRRGAQGEAAVGRKIDRLQKRGDRVLHSIVLGRGGDIDHLVISRCGVFSLNTKHHRRAVIQVSRQGIVVRRRPSPYAPAAHREAQRVKAALSAAIGRPVNVSPLVVVHGHARLRGWLRHQPSGVQVLPSWAVYWWFRLPGRALLTPAEIAAIYAVARRRSVWRAV